MKYFVELGVFVNQEDNFN